MNQRVVACIVVRMKSTRLPGKALSDVGGKPLLLRLVERVRQASTVDDIVICTSTHSQDVVLLEKAKEWGVASFAGHETDVLARLASAAQHFDADVILRITGDNLFVDAHYIDRLVIFHRSIDADYGRVHGLPVGVTSEVLARGMLPRLRCLIQSPEDSEYMMLYAFDPDHFRCAILGAPDDVYRPSYGLTVDTPKDLALARTLVSALGPNCASVPLSSIIAMIDDMEADWRIDDEAKVKMPGGAFVPFGYFMAILNDRALRSHFQALT